MEYDIGCTADSPTRRYRSKGADSMCCSEEHSTVEEAYECGAIKFGDKQRIRAVDWAFGLRAFVPTFGVEWQKEVAARHRYLNKE